jgi:penicillin-binding protein 1B
VKELDRELVERFAGRRWDLPSRIYSDSFVAYADSGVPLELLLERLRLVGYRAVSAEPERPGEFRFDPGAGILEVYLRRFAYPGRVAEPVPVAVRGSSGRIVGIERRDTGEALPSIEIEPEALAGIYETVWEERRVVRLAELPSVLVKAVLAAEDRRFFEHPGIDLRGILRALLRNLAQRRVVEGGSTLTQQLVKNFFLTEARTWKRKLTEAVMALLLEHRLTKLEILETYLNEIYLGQRGAKGIYGVWEGARFYFGKDPRDLTLAEAAMLAGLIKAPGLYSPTRSPERALQRRSEVLAALYEAGEIGASEYAEALAEPLPKELPTVEGTSAPYFVDFVRSELERRYPQDALTSQGFEIFTTLDPVLQREAERAVEKGLAELERRHPRLAADPEEPLQAALIALEPRSGEILAMVGGRSYRKSQFNRATQARRQPGSVFKPIVFLAAMEEEERTLEGRYLPTRRIQDEPFTWFYGGRSWSPRNYRDLYFGEVTLRQALELSLNSATARIAQELGAERIRDMAIRLGFPEDLPALPSIALGAVEVSPFEVAQAFAAIANLGFRPEASAIRAVLDSEGAPLTQNPMRAEQVVSPRVAYLVTHLMEGAVDRGTARAIREAGIDFAVAGKTGTTNEGRDAWFVGFTSDLVAVVWVGFDRERPLGLSGAQAALPIWIDFVKAATRWRKPAPFLVPAGIERVAVDPASGLRATGRCPVVVDEVFFSGEAPAEPCPLHPEPRLPLGPGEAVG